MSDCFDSWLSERERDAAEGDGEFAPGSMVGEYTVVAHLGRGGFADVYRARDSHGAAVAIKILHRLDDKSRMRFEREAKILSQIRHANIPRLLGFGSCGNRPYMVTELLRGCDLPKGDIKVAAFLRQIISAAAELHRHGYVHRDIKPSNILSREDGTPVLIDFGLACPVSEVEHETEAISVEDGKKVAVGTVGYSAPEQFSGLGVGPEADVHAIGMLIDRCYSGRMPGRWRRIYLAATTSNPKSRYQTMSALRRAIARRHWRKATFFILGVIVVAALAFLCVDKIRRYHVENRIPHIFHEEDI